MWGVGLHFPTPNLDFPAEVMGLGIYDPVVEAWLQTPAESAVAQAELALARAETAEARAEQAEAEASQLREELARLKAQSR